VNTQGEGGRTALIDAAVGGHVETVKILLDNGADASVETNLGRTAISYAAVNGYKEIVALLEQ
jgi:ankyrin repeat protein